MKALLQELFAANRIIVLFVYGQVFFVLGLAIALQSWRHSRLALARTLNWLALFGFMHGLHEWGDVFIPLQAQYLAPPFIDLLVGLQTILLSISFACLLQFGVETLRPLPNRWWWLRTLPIFLLVLWTWWGVGPALAIANDANAWHRSAAVWARYLIGFPGALLAAYSLHRQAREVAVSMPSQAVVHHLQWAAVALIGYAVFGGLVVPTTDFFPASWLNEELIARLTLIPVPVFRSLFGLLLTFAIIRTLEVFRIELDRRLMSLEENQIVLAERERIGRELHDGTLQKVYAAGLLLRAVERELARTQAEVGLERLQQSSDLLNQAVADIRGYIGALRTQADSRSLQAGLQEIAQARHLRSLVEINLTLNFPEDRILSPHYVGHVLAIASEALSNVARHAQATRVQMTAHSDAQGLYLEISDNGQGMPYDYVVGYGLRNMQERARLLGGNLAVRSQPGHGTTLSLQIPWSDGHDSSARALG
ncbi:MAG TPA: sensor histidine kinase [Caldilineaceae bacterium]|nr:sensor histidine kinase [Caldilineaceae bacterium]